MAFSKRRGRPKKTYETGKDKGTIQLQEKRQRDFTTEPLDLCLKKGLITIEQHNAGLRLRWLYTLRLGAPSIRSYSHDERGGHSCKYTDPAWLAKRQAEYKNIIAILDKNKSRKLVMDVCVFNQYPGFLCSRISIKDKNLENYSQLNLLINGLDLINKLKV